MFDDDAANDCVTCNTARFVTPCSGASIGAFVRMCFCDVWNTLLLTIAPQVYGGGISFVVSPRVWNSNAFRGDSSTSAGSTVVAGLSVVFTDCNFSGSGVSTHSISGPARLFAFYFHCSCACFAFTVVLPQEGALGCRRLALMYEVLIDDWVPR
jgi:hypothetical protein